MKIRIQHKKGNYYPDLAKSLKELRIGSRLMQRQVASEIEVKRSTYQAYEEGRANPPIHILIRIAGLYKVSIDALVYYSKPVAEPNQFEQAYYSLPLEKRKIVDFIMGL